LKRNPQGHHTGFTLSLDQIGQRISKAVVEVQDMAGKEKTYFTQ